MGIPAQEVVQKVVQKVVQNVIPRIKNHLVLVYPECTTLPVYTLPTLPSTTLS